MAEICLCMRVAALQAALDTIEKPEQYDISNTEGGLLGGMKSVFKLCCLLMWLVVVVDG